MFFAADVPRAIVAAVAVREGFAELVGTVLVIPRKACVDAVEVFACRSVHHDGTGFGFLANGGRLGLLFFALAMEMKPINTT